MTNRKNVNRTLLWSWVLISTSPPENSKMLYNHISTHILEKATKKERAFEFLIPLQVLSFIARNTIKNNANMKPLYWKKKQCGKILF